MINIDRMALDQELLLSLFWLFLMNRLRLQLWPLPTRFAEDDQCISRESSEAGAMGAKFAILAAQFLWIELNWTQNRLVLSQIQSSSSIFAIFFELTTTSITIHLRNVPAGIDGVLLANSQENLEKPEKDATESPEAS